MVAYGLRYHRYVTGAALYMYIIIFSTLTANTNMI